MLSVADMCLYDQASGGEDAHFFCSNAVGVADGVGGWAQYGVDAGEYARQLMTAGKEAVEVRSTLKYDHGLSLGHKYDHGLSLVHCMLCGMGYPNPTPMLCGSRMG